MVGVAMWHLSCKCNKTKPSEEHLGLQIVLCPRNDKSPMIHQQSCSKNLKPSIKLGVSVHTSMVFHISTFSKLSWSWSVKSKSSICNFERVWVQDIMLDPFCLSFRIVTREHYYSMNHTRSVEYNQTVSFQPVQFNYIHSLILSWTSILLDLHFLAADHSWTQDLNSSQKCRTKTERKDSIPTRISFNFLTSENILKITSLGLIYIRFLGFCFWTWPWSHVKPVLEPHLSRVSVTFLLTK